MDNTNKGALLLCLGSLSVSFIERKIVSGMVNNHPDDSGLSQLTGNVPHGKVYNVLENLTKINIVQQISCHSF